MKHSTFVNKTENAINIVKELTEKHALGLDACIFEGGSEFDYGFKKNILGICYNASWLEKFYYECVFKPSFNVTLWNETIIVEFGEGRRRYSAVFDPNNDEYPIKCERFNEMIDGMHYAVVKEDVKPIKVESFIKALNRFIEKLKFWTTCNGYKWHMKEKEEYPLF